MLEAGWPLHHVQEMLGHADVKTTSVYLNPTRQGLQESMRKFGKGEQALHDVAQSEKTEPPLLGNDTDNPPAKSLVNRGLSMVRPAGIEPAAPRLGGGCSIR